MLKILQSIWMKIIDGCSVISVEFLAISGKNCLFRGIPLKAIEVAHRGLEIVPAEKMPNDFFTIGLAEVLLRAGKKEEGEKLINDDYQLFKRIS